MSNKKNSIQDWINNLDAEQWDYRYENNNGSFNLPTFQNGDANRFIDEYFRHAGKDAIPFQIINTNVFDFSKANHSSLIFLLGVIINYNCFKKAGIYEGNNTSGYPQFSFVWFLTCLFHDIAYELENKCKNNVEFNNISEFKIKNKLLERNEYNNAHEALLNVVEPYYNYRISFNKRDHGIIGGLYLYDNLIKIREDKDWNSDLDLFYADAAAAIATHNIWFKDKNAISAIKELKEIKSVSFNDSSLLFLLGLVDSIDPLKIYSCIDNPSYILNNLLLSFPEDGKIRITVEEKSLLNSACLHKLEGNLDLWLDVSVKKITKGVIITFK